MGDDLAWGEDLFRDTGSQYTAQEIRRFGWAWPGREHLVALQRFSRTGGTMTAG